MIPDWPDTLPPLTELQNFSEEPPNLTLRTPMDAGPAKVRRRFTAGTRPMTGMLLLERGQVEILDDFYLMDLAGGALPFDTTHPRTGAAVSIRMIKPPRSVHASGLYWEASLEMEILP